MPLIGTNYYGTQVDRTPFDDAEAQRIAAENAWNMAQYENGQQNNRFNQGRSDAYAMNRDNLNFGAWQDMQNERRMAANAAAQERLAKLGFAHQNELFNMGETAAGAREARQNAREDTLFNQRGGADLLAQQRDLMARQKRALDLTEKQAEAERQFYEGTPGGGEETAGYEGAGTAPLAQRLVGKSSDEILQTLASAPGQAGRALIPTLVAQADMRNKAQADRILQDLASSDPNLRNRGLAAQKTAPIAVQTLLGPPREAGELGTIPLETLSPENKRKVNLAAQDVVTGANYQATGRGSELGSASKEDIQSQADQIRQRIDAISKSLPGVDPGEVWRKIVRPGLNTGGASGNPFRLFGAINTLQQEKNAEAVKLLDKEFGGI